LLRPGEQKTREARRASTCSQSRIRSGRRRSAGTCPFRRTHGLQWHGTLPKNEIVKFIESIGMRFGADLNAYTSFDETVYMLQVPTDKPEVMDKALLILEDWAHNVSFENAEIDKERGVVMEEWRLRRGAGARTTDKLFPILLKGSHYADRLPIG